MDFFVANLKQDNYRVNTSTKVAKAQPINLSAAERPQTSALKDFRPFLDQHQPQPLESLEIKINDINKSYSEILIMFSGLAKQISIETNAQLDFPIAYSGGQPIHVCQHFEVLTFTYDQPGYISSLKVRDTRNDHEITFLRMPQ